VKCAVVEMTSCWDQRVIRTKLEDVASAIEVERNQVPRLFVLDLSHVE
jgi:siroheme synthase